MNHSAISTGQTEESLFLIGFMGVGKTTVSQVLGRLFGMDIIETDAVITGQSGLSISRIFSEKGEACFRDMETAFLRSLGKLSRTVVSCGGGMALREEDVPEMKRNGLVVLLSAKPETVWERLKELHDRPLLEGHMNIGYIAELMEKRLPAYLAAADIIIRVDGKTPEDIAREIIREAAAFRPEVR